MAQDPLSVLLKMEQESLATAPGLPQEVQAAELWTGVGFRIGDVHLVIPLDSITEVLQYPDITTVPMTRAWFKGLANARGNLLSIVDLSRFYGREPIFIDDRVRILVVVRDDLATGLVVNEVFGLRHFDDELERQKVAGIDDPIMANTRGAFLRDNVLWGIFDIDGLVESATFMRVAV